MRNFRWRGVGTLSPLLFLFLGTSCGSGGFQSAPPLSTWLLTGRVTYDWVPAKDSGEGGIGLDYGDKAARPARRILVAAVHAGREMALAVTDDDGNYALEVPEGFAVIVRAKAHTWASGYSPDSIGSEVCNGASWDVKVVDNVTGNPASNSNFSLRALYAADGTTAYSQATTGADLHIPLTHNGSIYTNRAAAPFAMIDTVVSQLELVCQGDAAVSLPTLLINWSEDNTDASGQRYNGDIGTSFFTVETGGQASLYILGGENADTDEYDDHVIAHEFGHFLENKLYRSDSIGGPHSAADSLDPRVAFGEGFGYAIAGMTFNDPVAVDTNGSLQASGFEIDVSVAPTGDDLGVYSETAVQNFLWQLYENRDGTADSGIYDRMHAILRNVHRVTAAFTNVLTFASAYKSTYGDTAENLQTLWSTTLNQPWDALCVGVCSGGSDVADLFDVDNDIGIAAAAEGRLYRQGTGSTFTAEFWRMYRPLSAATTHTGTAHDQIHYGGYTGSLRANKLGNLRWYVYTHSGATTTKTVRVANLASLSCTSDYLDMYVWSSGTLIGADVAGSGSTAGCPSVSFTAQNGMVYVIEVEGMGTAITSYDIVVN